MLIFQNLDGQRLVSLLCCRYFSLQQARRSFHFGCSWIYFFFGADDGGSSSIIRKDGEREIGFSGFAFIFGCYIR